MRRSFYSVACVAVLLATVLCFRAIGADQGSNEGPKHSIKQVMLDAQKGGLLKKVLAEEATDEEKLALLDFYVSLAEAKPSKGDAESWRAKTQAILTASARVIVGRADGIELLENATSCAACHSVHK